MTNIYKEKIEQTIKYLNEFDIDAWLVYSSEGSDPSVSLLTGLKTVGNTFFIFTKEGRKISIASIIDAQESEDSNLFDEVIKYTADPEDALNKVLSEISPKTIALNFSQSDHLCDGLTRGRYLWLEKNLDKSIGFEFISSEKLLRKIRSIKTKSEVKLIKKAIDITTDIYDEVFSKIKSGMTEVEIGELFIEEMKKRGVVNGLSKKLTYPMILKERIAHREPSEAVLEKGDFLIIDFSVDYEGYVSDIARTAYLLKDEETKAPEKMQKRFDAVYEAISLVKDNTKPGMPGYQVDSIARDFYKENDMPVITHATGHQVGRLTHDGGCLLGPRWDRYGNSPYEVVEENMVFTIEPTILFQNGDYSILTEEIMLIKSEGNEFLSKRQEDIILI